MAFAATAAHCVLHGTPGPQLSEEYAHYFACSNRADFDPHGGTSPHDMFEAIEKNGQPRDQAWPYMETLPTDLSEYSPPSVTALQLFRHRGEMLRDFTDLTRNLQDGWPVLLGIDISVSFHNLRAKNVLSFDPDPISAGHHAVLAVGIRKDGPESVFLLRNSWGEKWADAGHGHVSGDYLEPRIMFMGVYRG
jgi:C1A family cysteine protease